METGVKTPAATCDERRSATFLRRSERRLKATFLTELPSPYSRDLFAAMRDDGRISPQVIYRTARIPGFDWGEPHLGSWETILPQARPGAPFQGVARALAGTPSDVYVVSGYSDLTVQSAMRWLHRRRLPWVFFGERPAMNRRGLIAGLLRKLAMRPAVRWPNGIAAVGELAVDSYRDHGRPGIPVGNLPYFSDLSPFQQQPASAGTVPSRFRLLYCGQLIERKGLLPLFKAFSRIAAINPIAELLLVGDGDLRETLQNQVAAHLRARIRFVGFRPVSDLPSLFAKADALVLPSLHDGWGVVINQAFGAGLPVIASDAVGAAIDLVRHGENGLIVPAGDVPALQEAILTLAESPGLCRHLAANASQSAASVSLASGVHRWHDFLNAIVPQAIVH